MRLGRNMDGGDSTPGGNRWNLEYFLLTSSPVPVAVLVVLIESGRFKNQNSIVIN